MALKRAVGGLEPGGRRQQGLLASPSAGGSTGGEAQVGWAELSSS